MWADGSDPTTDSPSSWRNISQEKFNDLMEKDLSVKEFDEILGITTSWTWEILEQRGWSPEKLRKRWYWETGKSLTQRNTIRQSETAIPEQVLART